MTKIRVVRKSIARLLTVLNEQRRTKAREETKDKKYQPRDLRVKGTRAFRRRLTKEEKSKKRARVVKRETNFKLRKFALAA